jgi:uncharacterized membrane protein YqaE (UPF0057 family)
MKNNDMLLRIVLAFIFPPLAVYDQGCGSLLLVLLMTSMGGLPGVVTALLICLNRK